MKDANNTPSILQIVRRPALRSMALIGMAFLGVSGTYVTESIAEFGPVDRVVVSADAESASRAPNEIIGDKALVMPHVT